MQLLNLLRLVLLSAMLFTVGCSSNNKGKIEATKWSSLASTVKGQAVPADALRLEFHGDGKVVYQAGPQTFTGTYSLGAGDRLTLQLNQELAGRKNHAQKVSISGDRLTMTDSDGTQLTFAKTN